jgi:PAS domain S-box-containing protein
LQLERREEKEYWNMPEKAFTKILTLLHHHTSVDFSLYKQATLRRRIARRMTSFKFKTLGEYADHLQTNPAEVKILFNDILIQVTGFFRDPFVFQWLEQHFRESGRDKKSEGIRVWSPACSTGEEVYSLAIVLAELTEGKGDCQPIQLFGTDINEAVLDKARAGIYASAIKKQVSPERLERFFEPVSGGFRIQKQIRDLCVFARHNLESDPPFSNLDLISCRNVLIYMDHALQRKIVPILHFGLKPDGILLLGTSETIGEFSDLFSIKEKKVKAYSKKVVKLKTIPEGFLTSGPVHASREDIGQKLSESAQKPLPHADIRNAVDTIQTWNDGAQRMYGYTADEVIGKSINILIPLELQDEEPEILARLRAGERIDHYETVRRRKDGQLIDISLTISPIKNSAGQIIGASKVARDITGRKQTILELKRAYEQAEKANKAKDDFLATLSHELRTPLNPILLIASDAVADLELPSGIRANFDVIRRNVELEAKLIDDLLDLTRIKTGKVKMEMRDVNIHAILSDAILIVRSEIEQKKLVLSQKLESPQSFVSGDQTRLQQIFWNVLKNAVKFAPPNGKIDVHAHTLDNNYVVTVTDTGIGMTPQELARVFDAFKQGDHSIDARRFGGLGLGLTISKKFVELHSGTIEAFSEGRNRGSVITIKFPLLRWEAHASGDGTNIQHENERTLQQTEILLVEDHEPTRTTLARLLASRGHKVNSAASVEEAMAFAEQQDFELIISDIELPDGDGCDLFRQLRVKIPNIKGIALSGLGTSDDLARSKNSGFCAHLVKPVEIQALEQALAAALIA